MPQYIFKYTFKDGTEQFIDKFCKRKISRRMQNYLAKNAFFKEHEIKIKTEVIKESE